MSEETAEYWKQRWEVWAEGRAESPAAREQATTPLSPVELVLYEHYRHLGCPGTVDPSDPEDCANVAVESVRALSAAGYVVVDPADERLVLRAAEAMAVGAGFTWDEGRQGADMAWWCDRARDALTAATKEDDR